MIHDFLQILLKVCCDWIKQSYPVYCVFIQYRNF